MKKGEKRPEKAEGTWLNAMCGILRGGVFGGLVAVAALFLCAALISSGLLKENAMGSAGLACCVLGGLVGGVIALRRAQGRTLLYGLGAGLTLFLLLLTAGFFLYDGVSLENGGWPTLCACCCGGAIAGIFAGKPKKKRRR